MIRAFSRLYYRLALEGYRYRLRVYLSFRRSPERWMGWIGVALAAAVYGCLLMAALR